jgi:hypothetical protein
MCTEDTSQTSEKNCFEIIHKYKVSTTIYIHDKIIDLKNAVLFLILWENN